MLQEPPSPQQAATPSNPDEPSAEYVEAGLALKSTIVHTFLITPVSQHQQVKEEEECVAKAADVSWLDCCSQFPIIAHGSFLASLYRLLPACTS